MRGGLVIIFATAMAAACSQPLLSGLQRVIVPRGQLMAVTSPAEPFWAFVLFAAAVCACASLATAVGCYFRHYASMVRWTIAILPMLLGSICVTVLKAMQFRQAASAAQSLGLSAGLSLKQAAFHMIPVAGFAAGLVAAVLALLIAKTNGPSHATIAPNAGSSGA